MKIVMGLRPLEIFNSFSVFIRLPETYKDGLRAGRVGDTFGLEIAKICHAMHNINL